MKKQGTCPVCGSPMETWEDRLDGWRDLLESTEDCSACGYSYSFSYGYNQGLAIKGGEFFQWGWSDTDENAKASAAFHKAVREARETYLGIQGLPAV